MLKWLAGYNGTRQSTTNVPDWRHSVATKPHYGRSRIRLASSKDVPQCSTYSVNDSRHNKEEPCQQAATAHNMGQPKKSYQNS